MMLNYSRGWGLRIGLAIKQFEVKLLDAEGAGVWLLPLAHHGGVDLLHGGPGRRLAEHGVVAEVEVGRGHAGGRGGTSGLTEEGRYSSFVCAETNLGINDNGTL